MDLLVPTVWETSFYQKILVVYAFFQSRHIFAFEFHKVLIFVPKVHPLCSFEIRSQFLPPFLPFVCAESVQIGGHYFVISNWGFRDHKMARVFSQTERFNFSSQVSKKKFTFSSMELVLYLLG